MIKRTVCVILCVLLTAAFFASCAKGEKQEDENESAILWNTYDSAYSSYESGVIYAYEDFCKAVYNGETECAVNSGFLDGVLTLFFTSCPLSALVKSVDSDAESGALKISYKFTPDEVKEKARAFEAKVQYVLEECKAGKVSDRAFILNTYKYVSENVKKSDSDGLTAYDAVMNGEGDSYSASNLLEFLLRQGGVKAYHIIATDAAGAGWGLSMVEIDGENYYLDPMTEQLANGGKALCNFGMTTDDANKAGLKTFVFTNRSDAPVCDNPYFDACRNSVSWEFSENGSSLIVTQNDGKIVEIAL